MALVVVWLVEKIHRGLNIQGLFKLERSKWNWLTLEINRGFN